MSTVVQHLEKCVVLEGKRKEKTLQLEENLSPGDEGPQRELKCEFCDGAVRACEMNHHLAECVEVPVDCPNGCEAAGETGTRQMKRGAIPLHLTECPLQRVECPYREYGCGEEMERRQLDLHEREYMYTHFRLAMKEMKQKQLESGDKIQVLEEHISNKNLQISLAKSEITQLKETISTLVYSGRLDWKIEGVKQKIVNTRTSYSDPFYVGLYKCQGYIHWDYDMTGKIGCFICIMKGQFDEKLKWPFIYRYKFVLLNCYLGEANHTVCSEVTSEDLTKYPNCFQRPTGDRSIEFGVKSFISNSPAKLEDYCREDSASFEIFVDQLPLF